MSVTLEAVLMARNQFNYYYLIFVFVRYTPKNLNAASYKNNIFDPSFSDLIRILSAVTQMVKMPPIS